MEPFFNIYIKAKAMNIRNFFKRNVTIIMNNQQRLDILKKHYNKEKAAFLKLRRKRKAKRK